MRGADVVVAGQDAPAHISRAEGAYARVFVRALLRVLLAALLLRLSLRLWKVRREVRGLRQLLPKSLSVQPTERDQVRVNMGEITSSAMAKVVLLLGMVASVHQANAGCKNCVTLGKEEKAMFRAHSDACLPTSHVDPALVEAMCRGELTDDPALKAHVYCILLKCKLISKEGKLQKNAVLGKVAVRGDGKNITKVLENCSDHQIGDSPIELAWNLLRCGFDKKAVLFDYMPTPDVAQA